MTKYIDKNGKELKRGDIIDLHQTINGQNEFIIFSLNPLDIRYNMKGFPEYEYNQKDLISDYPYGIKTEWEIIGSII